MSRKLIIIFALIGVLILLIMNNANLRKERNRLSDNQRVLLGDVDYYRTKDSLSAASVERLTLSNGEFSRYCSELKQMVESLGLKIKRLQSVSQTGTETKYTVKTIVKDSIIPGRTDTVRCIDYRNNYLTLSGCIEDKQFSGIIQSRDTIIQIVHRVPRKFWFIRWGTKAIRQEVISKNPYSQITYTEYIELKR